MFEIINTLKEEDITENFVAIGNLINENKEPYHSALIIKYNSDLIQYHYTGSEIELRNIDFEYFHKRTKTIHKEEIPAFIAYCKSIQKNANPIYGYFYSGEYYDNNGEHFCKKEIGERMTCVGFCLNVLKGFLEVDYLKYNDWDSSTHSNEYLIKYAEKHNLDILKIQESHRRISPIEILSSGFFYNTPISKIEIDSKVDEIKEYLINY
ncbi:hypothetical protein [Flavobacterium sp.]|uniref:hypothetical protein n=1 Tax=Flavobacterium sp. TaxID=239 RepID=UPI0037534890